MATFDQRHQQVGYQYNAAGNINVGELRTREDIARQLEQLRTEVQHARDGHALDGETATDAEYQLAKAAEQARQPKPDKQRLVTYLTEARALLEGVPAATQALSGLVNAIAQVGQQVQLHL